MPAIRHRNVRGHSPWETPQRDADWRPDTPEWQQQALCREVDPELFFVDIGPAVEARRVCELCPVINECLEWALEFDDDGFGIFGGVGPKIRAQMRRDREAVAV